MKKLNREKPELEGRGQRGGGGGGSWSALGEKRESHHGVWVAEREDKV